MSRVAATDDALDITAAVHDLMRRASSRHNTSFAGEAVANATRAMLAGKITEQTWKRYLDMILRGEIHKGRVPAWRTVEYRLHAKAHWHGANAEEVAR